MLFDTPIYLIFLSLIISLYWRLQWRQQNILLLLASYFFYGWWDWRFLSLILISTVLDYFCAQYISISSNPTKRKVLLALSVIINISFLGFFKYFNFFITGFADLTKAFGVPVSKTTLQIILPPGISFYTFQALAYIVDVYYKRLKPANRLVDYALFINLFPHLIAGPIQRPSHLLPQMQQPRNFHIDQFHSGIMLIAFGLFQKCVVADNCSLLADAAFGGKLGEPNIAVLVIGAVAFAWQIYGDFSGYSNIARGSAQLLGFHFMVNFRQPYLAISFKDFWRRWHISLSTWLRDYLYIPLGGSKEGEARTYRNLILTMLIGGFWHGANWTFIVWGGTHGVVLCIERFRRKFLGGNSKNIKRSDTGHSLLDLTAWVNRIVVFLLVCFGWIFFRASSVDDSFKLLSGAFKFAWIPEYVTAFQFLAMFCIPPFFIDLLLDHRGEEYPFEKSHPYFRTTIALCLTGVTLLFAGSNINAFIYFQF